MENGNNLKQETCNITKRDARALGRQTSKAQSAESTRGLLEGIGTVGHTSGREGFDLSALFPSLSGKTVRVAPRG
jgi:hypothetical protein